MAIYCVVFSLILCKKSNAFEVSERSVVQSAIIHYPKIYISEEKIRVAQSKLEEATGEFDTKLNIKQRQFVTGYYEDQGYLESKLTKPLPLANASVYTGYSRSQNGNYPEINQYYNTKRDGRAMFGFEFSLLRGFLINERDVLNKLAVMDVKISEYNNLLAIAQIKTDARKAYWKYFYTKKILDLYEEILQIAVKRHEALTKQVKMGDKAAIVLEENQRIILRRKSLVQNIKRELLNSAVYLSLYFRDSNGDMYDPNVIVESKINDLEFIEQQSESMPPKIDDILQNRLDVKIAEIMLNQHNVRIKSAKNDILPTLDLSFETSKDFGSGNYTKDSTSNKVALNVTIPIENNKQRGKYNKAKSDAKIIQKDLKLLKDSISNEVKMIQNKIHELRQIVANTKDEINISKKLVNAENTRFQNGDSDFFMLNAREQDLLYALEYGIRNKLGLTEVLIEYNFITQDALLSI